MDKAVEIMKAAMQKEQDKKEMSKDAMNDQIDAEAQNNQSKQNDAEDIVSEKLEEMDEDMVSEEEIENQDEASGDTKKEKSAKSFFKSGKSKELAAKDQKIAELTDRLMRTMAEFDNFRKRSEKEKAQMYDIGVKSIVEKLLPIVDNFERGLGTITEKEKESAFAQGIELIHKQFVTALDEIGVKPIDAVGKEFDPNLHNAVMHGEDETLGANIVSDEFQKGYMYRDYVVRHSMVKVVN
jgi:molecular chaperone GrpE